MRINDARNQVATDPDQAEQIIQQQDQRVWLPTSRSSARIRDRLLRMLDATTRDIKHRKEEFIRQSSSGSARDERHARWKWPTRLCVHDEKKVKQLMDRFDSLMAEGRHKLGRRGRVEAEKIVQRGPLRMPDR